MNDIVKFGGFEIAEAGSVALGDDYTKLKLTNDQKAQIHSLLQYAPAIAASDQMTNCYRLVFPDGLPHTLVKLRQGGVMSTYVSESGKYAGTGSLYSLDDVGNLLGGFTALSVVTGQYFLANINKELKTIKQGIDKILDFLYEDKNAELVSEFTFMKYAYENFSSIMNHNEQRIATIENIQQAEKIALKNIEFYLHDLESTVAQKDSIDILFDKAMRVYTGLELAIQLYSMSHLLEVYYSENFELGFVQYIENEIKLHINKTNSRINSAFSVLEKTIRDSSLSSLIKRIDKKLYLEEIEKIIKPLTSGEEPVIIKALREGLNATTNKQEYFLTRDGSVYLKQA